MIKETRIILLNALNIQSALASRFRIKRYSLSRQFGLAFCNFSNLVFVAADRRYFQWAKDFWIDGRLIDPLIDGMFVYCFFAKNDSKESFY